MLRRLTTEGVGILAILVVGDRGPGAGGGDRLAPRLRPRLAGRRRRRPRRTRSAVPTPDAARAWLRALTEEPHVAGTPADHKTAVDVRDKLRDWGWKAELAEYEVLLNYPVPDAPASTSCELVRPDRRDAVKVDRRRRSPPTRTRPAPTPSPPSTATASRATSPARSSTPTTAGPRTSPRWRSWASTSEARSSWSATARSSAA